MMWRSVWTQCTPVASRSLASSSSCTLASRPLSHQLHTTAPINVASEHRRKIRTSAQRKSDKTLETGASEENSRPHVVLGHRPGDESKWTNCDLAKVILTEETIRSSTKPSLNQEDSQVVLPEYVNYGIGEKERGLLFEVLPALTQEGNLMVETNDGAKAIPDIVGDTGLKEATKTELLARLVDLRNANKGGIVYENRKRIVAAFSRPENAGDTGSPEVQAALVTMRIRNVWDHLRANRKDVASRRGLRVLIHKRAKILKYLKRLDRDRYDAVLERLGLEAGSVEGELVV